MDRTAANRPQLFTALDGRPGPAPPTRLGTGDTLHHRLSAPLSNSFSSPPPSKRKSPPPELSRGTIYLVSQQIPGPVLSLLSGMQCLEQTIRVIYGNLNGKSGRILRSPRRLALPCLWSRPGCLPMTLSGLVVILRCHMGSQAFPQCTCCL